LGFDIISAFAMKIKWSGCLKPDHFVYKRRSDLDFECLFGKIARYRQFGQLPLIGLVHHENPEYETCQPQQIENNREEYENGKDRNHAKHANYYVYYSDGSKSYNRLRGMEPDEAVLFFQYQEYNP
jgi:hypothetical protein